MLNLCVCCKIFLFSLHVADLSLYIQLILSCFTVYVCFSHPV
uniref:Uncharacterized protein n=1 Tax=Arundo donax TaxID=35708 RepID=A0A0A9BXG0_ARUDO